MLGKPGDEAAPADESVLTLRREVAASPARVWDCLVDPDCFKVWWRENLEFDPRQGGTFVEPWTDPEGRGRVTRSQVTAFHPPNGIVMVWADDDWSFDTIVSVWIEAHGAGSLVTLEHRGWDGACERERAALIEDHESGWSRHLAGWASHAETWDARRKGH